MHRLMRAFALISRALRAGAPRTAIHLRCRNIRLEV